MSKKTKIATLEIPEEEAIDEPDENETVEPETPDTDTPPAELTQDEKIEAYIRKEQVVREAQSELDNLKNAQATARREVNSYKKPIDEAEAKVRRLNTCDVSGNLVRLGFEAPADVQILRSELTEHHCPGTSMRRRTKHFPGVHRNGDEPLRY